MRWTDTSAAAGWMRFALLSFAGTLALRGMAWTPRALRPEIPCDSPGLPTIGGGSANLSSAFFNAWTFNCERKPNTATLFPASLLNARPSSWLPFSAGYLLGMRQGRGFSLIETQESARPSICHVSPCVRCCFLTARRNSSAHLRCALATPGARRQQLAHANVRTCAACAPAARSCTTHTKPWRGCRSATSAPRWQHPGVNALLSPAQTTCHAEQRTDGTYTGVRSGK